MSKSRLVLRFFAGAVLAIVLGPQSYCQITTGSILGTVADETGARTPGATVTITSTETGIARTLTTDAAGRYRAANLPLGQYEVKAELTGFRTTVRRGFGLTVGAEIVVDLSLSVGTVSEQVEVTGEAPMVDTTSSTVSGLVADQQVQDLPLNGRSFESLIFLQSGTSGFMRGDKSAEAGNGTKLTVSGSRIDSNSFLLDGANMNDQSNMTPGSAAGVLMGVDILREFRVLTSNYSAEYGRVSGGIINAVTKSGTNSLHGGVFEYLRNSALDARSFFDQEKPAFRRNQFGATLGGRIKKDRTFYFVAYEGLRQGLGVTQLSFVPTAEAHAGLLRDSAGVLQPRALNPAVRPYLDLYPLPNGPTQTQNGLLTDTARYIESFGLPTREDFGNVRMDHQISANHSFFGRYTMDDSQTTSPNANRLMLDVFARNQYVTLAETAILSPTVINLARMSFSRSNSVSDNRLLYNVPKSLWFIPSQQFGVIVFQTGGIDPLGNIISQPQKWARQNLTATDDVTLMRGAHTLKMGFLFERYQENGYKERVFGAQYTFANLGSFFSASPFDVQAEPPGNDPVRGSRSSLFGGYFQDDIQLRPNLTMNAGLRYELGTVPKEVNGKLSNYPNPLTAVGSKPQIGDPWFTGGKKDFAPRVGLAWDPFSNGKTSIRAGFGLYFDHVTGAPYNRAISRVYPFHQFVTVRSSATTVVTFPQINPSFLAAPDPNTFVNYSLNGWLPDPAKVSWTFSVQQQLGANTAVTASYVGSHAYHQTLAPNGNQAVEAKDPVTGRWYVPQPARFRNPNIGQVSFFLRNEGNAFYNGLQLNATRRMARGFQAQFSYTWSKTISEGDGILGRFFDREARAGATVVVNPDIMKESERSLAQTDFRNVASVNFTYELPLAKNLSGAAGKILSGWAVNSIITASSGNPLGLSMGGAWSNGNVSGGTYADRPDLKAGGNNNPVLGGPDRYYDTSQFVLPPQIVSSTGVVTGRFHGNLARMTLIGPGMSTIDFSLVKNTALRSEGLSMQFRAEFFNLLNRANFGLPFNLPITNTGAADPRAGVIDRTLTPGRQVQFALKFLF